MTEHLLSTDMKPQTSSQYWTQEQATRAQWLSALLQVRAVSPFPVRGTHPLRPSSTFVTNLSSTSWSSYPPPLLFFFFFALCRPNVEFSGPLVFLSWYSLGETLCLLRPGGLCTGVLGAWTVRILKSSDWVSWPLCMDLPVTL